MKKNVLLALWGGMFILCGGCGFIPEPAGLVRWLLSALSAVFFLPPALLLYDAHRTGDRAAVVLVRNLSALSLTATLVLLVLNFLSVLSSETAGRFLYYLLTLISSPMVCSGYWALSLFLWACLLTVSRSILKKQV